MRRQFHPSLPAWLAAGIFFLISASLNAVAEPPAASPIRVVIVGLVHGHAQGLLNALPRNNRVQLAGIVEPDTTLARRYADQFQLSPKLFYTDTDKALDALHPDAVLVYTSIQDHRRVIEAAAARGISSMVEKPLATTVADALAIQEAAQEHHVQVLVNYETTWYASNTEAFHQLAQGKLGELRRVVVHDGHEGPKEIGVGPEFLDWLTDPEKNGAGAMFDFGCYGADLMTWLMHGQTPLSVTAVAMHDKPETYPNVDDDATIIVRYAKAQAVLQPSWTWPFSRKDMEVYGTTGYLITEAADQVRVRHAGQPTESRMPAPKLEGSQQNSLDYLAAVLHGEIKPAGDLSSLETNMVVVQILDAARESAKTGRTVELTPLPK